MSEPENACESSVSGCIVKASDGCVVFWFGGCSVFCCFAAAHPQSGSEMTGEMWL